MASQFLNFVKGVRYRLRLGREATTLFYDLNAFHYRKAIFVHVPKTGGVSVSTAVYKGLSGGHKTVNFYREFFGHDTYDKYFSFTFVRQPEDRFLSAVNFLLSGGMSKEDKKWADLFSKESFDLNEFVLTELAEQVSNKKHFFTQRQFLVDENGTVNVNFIGKYENLLPDFKIVARRIGIKDNLPHLNNSPCKSFDRSDLNREALHKIYCLYAQDYQLGDYQPLYQSFS